MLHYFNIIMESIAKAMWRQYRMYKNEVFARTREGVKKGDFIYTNIIIQWPATRETAPGVLLLENIDFFR